MKHDELDFFLRETEAVRAEIRAAVDSVDWEALPAKIAARAPAGSPETGRAPWTAKIRDGLAPLRMRPVLAGLLGGLVIGAAAASFVLRAPVRRPGAGGRYYASGEFLDRAELEMARRSAVDYLEKSQHMLLDVFESAGGAAGVPASLRVERARDLLQKKKYLNAQLERLQMAKAKALCDQIEALFLELSQLDDGLAADELGKIRGYAEERQLLLKINLVKKELQSGV